VSVHKSSVPTLDFISKNFIYTSITFQNLVENCTGLKGQPTGRKGQGSKGQHVNNNLIL
jgi:hypothetical protein